MTVEYFNIPKLLHTFYESLHEPWIIHKSTIIDDEYDDDNNNNNYNLYDYMSYICKYSLKLYMSYLILFTVLFL